MAEEIRFNELANVGELSPSAIVAIVQEQQGELVSLQCSAAQIADLIVNGIQFQALTSEDKKIIGAINEVLAKVDDLELFKFPNATIIGAPTINNGQISGFSQTSYLQFPFLMDFQGRHFAINMEFTTAADVTNQQNIFDSDFGLAFAIRSGKFVIAVSSNGTSWNIGEGIGSHTVLSNTTYRVQLAWDGTAYKLAYSVNGGESYTEDISLASTASPFPKQVYIGVGENYTAVLNFFKGIINLNYASLYVADSLVWQGMDDVGLASRLATDLSNIDAAGEQRIKDIAGGGGGNVDDIQINGTSIVEDGVANIPTAISGNANGGELGLVRPFRNSFKDIFINGRQYLQLEPASDSAISSRFTGGRPITVDNLDFAFKSAMTDGKGAEWTDAEKLSAQKRIGVDKEWQLKGTIIDSDITVDFTGCTEFIMVGYITGQSNGNLNLMINGVSSNRTYGNNFIQSGTRYYFLQSRTELSYIVPISGKNGTGKTPTYLGTNYIPNTILNCTVADIVSFILDWSIITECNIKIYAR